MAAVIKRAKLFIGLDSFPLHVAEAMRTPAVGLFGVTDPKFIITQRDTTIGVCGTTPSFGLRHRSPNTTVVDDKGAAMDSITVTAVMEAATRLLAERTVTA
jgi:heptosyltransferase III